MSENFSKDTNGYSDSESGAREQKIPEAPETGSPGSQSGRPFTNPVQTPPPYFNGQYANSNQYMPYGMYPQKPAAEKKPSAGRKKGFITAIIILCAAFLIAVTVIVSSFIFRAFSTTPEEAAGDSTQLTLVDTPAKNTVSNPGEPLSPEEVFQKVYESSVGVLAYSGNQQQICSQGTGIVMGTNDSESATYIITCAHVIDVPSPSITVLTHDGMQYDAVIVGADTKTDIGLIRINATGLKAAEFANSDSTAVGNTVYAIGNPGGVQFFGSFTSGMISAIGRPVNSPVGYEVSCIQHTAPINPGNSGGALVNEYGQIIGMNSSKIASTDFEGMAFAVPTVTVKEIVDDLIKNGRVTNRPILGIKYFAASYSQTYSKIIKANDLPTGAVIIDSISANSDLNNLDVRAGDMIIGVNGQSLESYDLLLEAIEKGKVGDEITLTICRVTSETQFSTYDITAKLVEDTGDITK